MSDGADYQQQSEIEEFEQYLTEQNVWFNEQLDKFNEIFGVDHEQLSNTKQD